MKVTQLKLEDFVARISKSQNLIHVTNGIGTRCKIAKAYYGGARTDRLRERNKLTNALGFEKCSGRVFLSAEDLEGNGGIFLADIMSNYGKNEFFIENGEAISFQSDQVFDFGGCGYGDMCIKRIKAEIEKNRQAMIKLVIEQVNESDRLFVGKITEESGILSEYVNEPFYFDDKIN